MKRQLLRLGTLILLAILAADSVVRAHEGHAALPTRGAKVEGERLYLTETARKAVGLTTGKVELTDLERAVTANARVEVPFGQSAFVTTLIAGRIENVQVGPGEAVAAGQELATIAGLELETLQLDLLRLTGELDLAQRTFDRLEMLSGQGAVAGKSLQAARAERQTKAAELRIVRLKLQSLGLSDATIDGIAAGDDIVRALSLTSPIDGFVADADVRAGQIVEPTQHLYHIVNADRVWIAADVLESDAAKVAVGMQARVVFPALDGRRVTGAIDYVASALDPESGTLTARLSVENADGALRPGQFGRMRIAVERMDQAIACPAAALIRVGDGYSVLLQEAPGQFLRKPVTVGLRNGKRVEILRGLFPGDRVVLAGSNVLASMFGGEAPPVARAKSTEAASATAASEARLASHWLTAQARVELPTGRKSYAAAGADGRVSRILVRQGERVQAGQVLAEIESLAVRDMQLQLLSARVLQQRAGSLLENLEEVGEVAAKKELWELRTDLATAEQTVAGLSRQLELVGISPAEIERLIALDLAADMSDGSMLATLPIRAPAEGIVDDFQLTPGQVVAPEERLFEIHDPSRVWVQAFVFEQEAAGIRVGQRVRVRLPADPEYLGEATIVRASPQMTGAERVFSVWAEFDNPDLTLKEGMSAWMEIEVGALPGALAAETE